MRVNKELIEFKNIDILKECMGPVLQRIEANAYDGKPEQINEDIKTASQEFNRRAKGETKGEILSEFITTINPIVLEIQKKKNTESDTNMKAYEKEEYERTLKIMRDKVKSLEDELAKNRNRVSVTAINNPKTAKGGDKM